ncbi:MAG TPA: hypothetical protein VGV59_02365 [Pyrinomonadaceae bacterium]|nr:hypothetical protein [Pyrinomonadaceae bacterium]
MPHSTTQIRPGRVAGYLWLVLLALVLLLSARNAYRIALSVEEYPYACDSFGYLEMAKQMREAGLSAPAHAFHIESEQTRLLVELMRSRGLPQTVWNNLVAPHAHHYFPQADRVGVQYPPGTSAALALFDEGRAVYGLNRAVVWTLTLAGLAALIFAAVKRAWGSAALVVLGVHTGFEILARVGAVSFSINVVFVPLLLACLLSLVALRMRAGSRRLLESLAVFGAGFCMGLATLVRHPSVFMTPAFVILLWRGVGRGGRGGRLREVWRGVPVLFLVGLALGGLLPIFIHQQLTAGAWYVSTYSPSVSVNLPTLEILRHNLSYYFGEPGWQNEDNWVLPVVALGFAGAVAFDRLRRRPGAQEAPALSWKRLALAAFALYAVPTAYFLTQKMTGLHYLMAQTFGLVVLAGFGALAIESARTRQEEGGVRLGGARLASATLAFVLALAPGAVVLRRAWTAREKAPQTAPAQPLAHQPVVLPPELADERAWVYADLLTGTIWYYARKPAFRIHFGHSAEARALVYRFAHERGEPQYIIRDNEGLKPLMDEIERLGGTFERRGQVEGQDYFLIRWPETGPRTSAAATNPIDAPSQQNPS